MTRIEADSPGCIEIADVRRDKPFSLQMWQTGSGSQTNMLQSAAAVRPGATLSG